MQKTINNHARRSRRSVGLATSTALLAALLTSSITGLAHADTPALPVPAGQLGVVQQAMIDASAQAKSSGQSVPVAAATDAENTLTANPDGTFSRTTSASPVRVQQNGTWVPLDPTLRQNSDATWSTTATTSSLVLSNGGPAGSTLASMNDDGQTLTLTWPTALPAPSVTGDTAVYSGILPGVDLQITSNDTGGFTDLVIVNTPAAAQNPLLGSLTLGTTTSSGLTLATDSAGGITATDANGDVVYTAPAPTMYDSGTSSGTASPSANPSTPSSPAASATASNAQAAPRAKVRAANAHAIPVQDSSASPAPGGNHSASATATADSSPSPGPAGTPVEADFPGVQPSGAQSAPVTVSISAGSMTLTPSQSMLHSPTTVFPLVIDPSISAQWITHKTSEANTYTYIQQGCPGAANWDANTSYDTYGIGVGFDGAANCNGIERSEYQFSIGTFVDNDQIQSATMNVDETYIAWNDCDSSNNNAKSTVTAWAVPHISQSTSWSNFNSVGASQLDSEPIGGANRTGCAGDYASSFNVTNAVSSTPDGIVTVELRGDESNSNQFKRFAKNASITFNYNTTPNQPTSTATTPTPVSPNGQGCTQTSSQWGWIPIGGSGGNIVLSAKVSDPDGTWGQQVEGQFALYDVTAKTEPIVQGQDSGNLFPVTSTDDSLWAASGSVVTKTFATSNLTDGHTYDWNVITWDGIAKSAATQSCYFKYDSSAPGALTIGGSAATSGTCVNGGSIAEGTASTLALGATDTESGLKQFHYAWQDGSTLADNGGTALTATNGSATVSFTPTNWGNYTLWVNATDNAGNQSAVGCYTFNVTYTPGSTPPASGDITGTGHPDIITADPSGSLDMWATTDSASDADAVQISPAGYGPGGSWQGALMAHGLSRIPTPSNPPVAATPDDLWALSGNRQNLYFYRNIANTPAAKNSPPPPYFTNANLLSGCTSGCSPHPLVPGTQSPDWTKVNQLLAVGDLNDDKNPDLVTEESGGNLYALYTNGSGSLTSIQLLGNNPSWDNWTFISPGNTTDDKDGVAQLWARDNTAGTLWAFTLTSSGGTDTLGTPVQISTGGTNLPATEYPQILSVGDINDDGLPDLAATTANGSLVQLTNTGTTTAPAFNASGSGPAQLQAPGWLTTITALDSNPAPLPASGPLALAVPGANLCVDDPASDQIAGTTIWDYTCNGTPAQQWTLQPDGTIRAQNSSTCLTTTNGNDQSILLEPCTDTTLQEWQLLGDGSLQSASATDGNGNPVCLADPNANPAPKIPLISWTCDHGSEQQFTRPGTGSTSHWLLNDTAGSTAAANSTASNPAEANGTVSFGATGPSTSATAASFNGSSTLQANTAINAAQSYTVSAWVKLGSLSGQQWAAAEGDTNHSALYLGYNGTQWQFMSTTSDAATTTYAYAAGGTPTLNTWTHITGTYDTTNGTLTLYVNGISTATATNTTPVPGGNLTIGGAITTASGAAAYQTLTGSIADVQTYNRALNPRQVQNLYDTGASTN